LARKQTRNNLLNPLALTLIGAGHLLFAGRPGNLPEAGAVRKVVTTVIAGAARP
jgi:hypothetical protein